MIVFISIDSDSNSFSSTISNYSLIKQELNCNKYDYQAQMMFENERLDGMKEVYKSEIGNLTEKIIQNQKFINTIKEEQCVPCK